MAAPSLGFEEYQFTDTGVLLNGSASSFPFVDILTVDGLDTGEVRQQTQPREGMHGGFVEAYFSEIRTVTLSGVAYTSGPRSLEAYLDSLKANFAPSSSDLPLYWNTGSGLARMVNGRSLGLRYNKDNKVSYGAAEIQIQVMCQDPHIYSTDLQTPSRTTAGTLALTNGGNRSTPGLIVINGPVSNPTITDNIANTQFSFSAYTLPSGSQLVIDLGTHSVMENGVTNRRNKMTMSGNWYEIAPGAHTFTFTGAATGAGTAFSVQFRDAWW